MLEILVAVRDIIFAVLMSWAGISEGDAARDHSDETRSQPTISAPAVGFSR